MKTFVMFILCTVCTISFHNNFSESSKGKIGVPEELIPIRNLDSNEKKVYLTFDDGPSLNTIKILNILDRYQVKATFFVIGNEEDYADESYRAMISRGHSIGLHSYTHDYNLIYRSKKNFFQDLKRLEWLLDNKYGVKSHFVRIPGGSNNRLYNQTSTQPLIKGILEELTRKDYIYMDWNVDSKDGDSPFTSSTQITRNVLNQCKGQKQVIILLHDINDMKNTVVALPRIIEGLKREGYMFDVIDETTKKIQFN